MGVRDAPVLTASVSNITRRGSGISRWFARVLVRGTISNRLTSLVTNAANIAETTTSRKASCRSSATTCRTSENDNTWSPSLSSNAFVSTKRPASVPTVGQSMRRGNVESGGFSTAVSSSAASANPQISHLRLRGLRVANAILVAVINAERLVCGRPNSVVMTSPIAGLVTGSGAGICSKAAHGGEPQVSWWEKFNETRNKVDAACYGT